MAARRAITFRRGQCPDPGPLGLAVYEYAYDKDRARPLHARREPACLFLGPAVGPADAGVTEEGLSGQ